MSKPPHSHDAERALLGRCLIDEEAPIECFGRLKPEMFYDQKHEAIYKAVHDLVNENKGVDRVTVTEWLDDEGLLDVYVDETYIRSLVMELEAQKNVDAYIEIVREKYILRSLGETLMDAQAKVYSSGTRARQVLDDVQGKIMAITEVEDEASVFSSEEITSDVLHELKEVRESGQQLSGLPYGYSKIEELTGGIQKGELSVVAGRPSMGKSAFMLNVIRFLAVDEEVPCAIFSLEVPKNQVIRNLLTIEAEVDGLELRNGWSEEDEWQRVIKAGPKIERAPIYIDDSYFTISELKSRVRKLVRDKDIKLVVVDYLQLMGADVKYSNREKEISEISRGLKQIAKEQDIAVVAISQLNRGVENRGGMKKPQLADLRESGQIEQDADFVSFVYRPERYDIEELNDGTPTDGLAQIIISKQRNGPLGEINLDFDKKCIRFYDRNVSASVDQWDGNSSGESEMPF